MLLGGAVKGGPMIGEWPGLSKSALHEGRDVRPANDYRVLFKGLLHNHLGIAEAIIEDQMFPGSRPVTAMTGLLRRA